MSGLIANCPIGHMPIMGACVAPGTDNVFIILDQGEGFTQITFEDETGHRVVKVAPDNLVMPIHFPVISYEKHDVEEELDDILNEAIATTTINCYCEAP